MNRLRAREARVDARRYSAILFVLVTTLFVLGILLLTMNAGRTDHAPYYRADGAIVHGDWGLYRPGHVTPWVEGPAVIAAPRFGMGEYFPSNRNDPGAYRRRPPVDPRPIPPEPYYRSWGAQSQNPNPAGAAVYAPFEPPAVIYAPKIETGKKSKH